MSTDMVVLFRIFCKLGILIECQSSMKHYLFSITLAAVLAFSACRSNKKQIERTWTVTKVTQAGTDLTASYVAAGYKETYASGGAYSYTGQPGSNPTGSGSYSWDNKTSFKRNGVSSQPSVTCTVKKLTNSDFEYSYTDKGDEWVFTFKK